MSDIERIAAALHPNNPAQAMDDVDTYRAHILSGFDHMFLIDREYDKGTFNMSSSATKS
ncbi:MAG: hypothetical protein U0223_12285 [Nitrospira sp.]